MKVISNVTAQNVTWAATNKFLGKTGKQNTISNLKTENTTEINITS